MPALRLLRFDSAPAPDKPRCRTADIERAYIEGYPTKLYIYRLPASSFWWVRYYIGGKTLKKSTKQVGKREAIEFAKRFFETVTANYRNGIITSSPTSFRAMTKALLAAERAKLERGDITKITFDNYQYRCETTVMPYFGNREVAAVNYVALEDFVTALSSKGISSATVRSYLQLVRKVLSYASKRDLIQSVPEFPTIKVRSKPRGWFTPAEYLTLWRAARRLVGVRMEIRKHRDQSGNKQTQYIRADDLENKIGRRMCSVDMTEDLVRLIVFMVNGYIRPTDIKHMKHRHVEVVRRPFTYLRLRLPESKGHTDPITTMPKAVTTYLALKAYHAARKPDNKVSPDDYVFMPDHKCRDYALQLLQNQFEVIARTTGLAHDVNDETRTLYSLRHSSIMFRLLYGEGINTLVLARNARTSVSMIDRFYAKPLNGEMNIEMLQSRRRRRNGR